LARFGCPRKIIIDNSQAFKSTKMVQLCQNYNIELGNSTSYYPQGNGLVESSNKILIRIIKKMLSQNKKAWDSHLKYAVWEDRVNTKRSIGTSPFQLVYGLEAIFPIHLSLPVMKLLQNEEEESDDMQRRISQLIEVQHTREHVQIKSQIH
jgi:transposase InsO family protein